MNKHGYGGRKNKHPLYIKWAGIIQRCENKNSNSYDRYGGRGIDICSEWRNDPEAFIQWSKNNGWEAGLQIDRINNNKGYSPENCRFVTCLENNNNKRPRKKQRDSINPYIGSIFDNRRNKWFALINVNGKDICIAYFSNSVDAAVARDSYIIKNKLNRTLNFPQPITTIKSANYEASQ